MKRGERKVKRSIFSLAGLAVFVLSMSSMVQAQWYRGDLKQTINKLEEDSFRFAQSLDSDVDRSRFNKTNREDEISEINKYVHQFEDATDHLKARSEERGVAPGFAREVLSRGRAIDRFMRRNRTSARTAADWRTVRKSLERLAWVYKIDWRW